jgi:hypothetical protein
MSAGLLDQWRRHATVVPMGGIGIVYFQNTRAIATEHLGSCSVVIIASAHAAILAHIPPNQATTDPYAGDRQAQSFMNQVAALYQQNISFFPSAQGLVVCAVYNGSVALPSQRDIMSSSLLRMGIRTTVRTYTVPTYGNVAGRGTVIAFGPSSTNPQPLIYVEDRLS